jgi:hypothetical protein
MDAVVSDEQAGFSDDQNEEQIMKWGLNYIRKETWSPYVAGILLGWSASLAVWRATTCWALRARSRTCRADRQSAGPGVIRQ